MKKCKSILVALCLAVSVCAVGGGLAACDEGHTHDWESDYTVDTPATCTEDGSKSIHCKDAECDGKKNVTTIPAAHVWEEDYTVDTPATTCVDGSKSIHCANCEETKDTETIFAVHNWDDKYTVDTPAICEEGSKSIHCKDCDAKKEVTTIPAAHAWEEDYTVDTPATSDAAGSKSKHCKNCKETTDVQVIPIDHDHVYNDFYTTDVWSTCSVKGSESVHCSLCDHTKDSRDLPLDSASHNSVTYHEAVAAKGCVNGTIEYWSCADCGNNYGDINYETKLEKYGEIEWAPEPHSGGDIASEYYVSQVDPSCEHDGHRAYYTCKTCDGKFLSSDYIYHTITYTGIKKVGHDDVTTPNIPATEDEIFMAAHGWNKDFSKRSVTYVYASEPTCSKNGSSQTFYSCGTCNKYFSDRAMTVELDAAVAEAAIIPATGHTKTPARLEAVAATCTSVGHPECWYCSQCERYFDIDNTELNGSGSAKRAEIAIHPNLKSPNQFSELPEDVTITARNADTITFKGTELKSFLGYCPDCKKYFYVSNKFALSTLTEVTNVNIAYSTTTTSNYGTLVSLGNSKVATKGGVISFQAPQTGTYTFTLTNGQSQAGVVVGVKVGGIYYRADGANGVLRNATSGKWLTNTALPNRGKIAEDGSVLGNTFTVCMEQGDIITVYGGTITKDAKGNDKYEYTTTYFEVNVKKEATVFNALKPTDTSVTVSEADAWTNGYRFVSAADKIYGLQLGAGLSAALVSANYDAATDHVSALCVAGGTAYIKATAYKPVFLVFKGATADSYSVTFSEVTNPVGDLWLGTSTGELELSAREQDGSTITGGVKTLTIGSIAEGTYTLTIELGASTGRSNIYFGVNTSETWTDYFEANGNNKGDKVADAFLTQMHAFAYNNHGTVVTAIDGWTWTITLDLKTGDKLVFVLGDTTDVTLGSVTLTPAD